MDSNNRFLTTHTGSLPRPDDLISIMYAKEEGQNIDHAELGERIYAKLAAVKASSTPVVKPTPTFGESLIEAITRGPNRARGTLHDIKIGWINLEKIRRSAAAPRRYSGWYFECCGDRDTPGSLACRDRHSPACSHRRAAACGREPDTQIGRYGWPLDHAREAGRR